VGAGIVIDGKRIATADKKARAVMIDKLGSLASGPS
jgi:hypothetical protein